MKICKQLRYYFESAEHQINISTYQENLHHFLIGKLLKQIEDEWCEKLSGFYLQIEYKPGRLNSLDVLV